MNTNKIESKTNQDLPTQVKKWVEEQGYSLEMRVAKKFQENGFTVSQFEHFVDQESHSVRPVDVVASLSQDVGGSRVVVKLFVEYKYSAKDKPWVIVVTSDKFDKYAFFSRTLKNQHPSNWMKISTLQGRLTARLIQNIERVVGPDSFSIRNPGYVVAEIESGTVFVPYRRHETNPNSKIILSPVTVVTEKYLDNYVALIKKALEVLLSQTEAIQEVVKYEQEQIINPRHEDEF